MTRLLTVSAAACALLAGCSSQGNEQQAPDANEEAAGAPAADAPAQTVSLETMPEAFRGHWEFAEEDCAVPASEGRLEIEADQVTFYESSAEITGIERTEPRSLTVEHHFTGEGEEWNETLGYELSEAGDRLNVTTPEGDLSIRMRCG